VFSLWSEINSQSERFTNHMFAPSEQATVLSPSTLSKNIKCVSCSCSCHHLVALASHSNHSVCPFRLWKGYFCRWDPTVIPPVPAFQCY
jgi:hypothetical protein